MKKILLVAPMLVLMTLSTLFMFAPNVAAAYSCGYTTKTKDGKVEKVPLETSIDFGALCNKPGVSPITAVILYIINFLSIGVGIGVVIGIIIGGLMYSTSDGNASNAQKGKDVITNSIIGLFLYIFLYAIANFFIPGGIFR